MIADVGELIELSCDPETAEYALATVRCMSAGVPAEAQVPIEYRLTLDSPQVPFLKTLFERGAKLSLVFVGTHYVAQEGGRVIHTVGCRYFGVELTSSLTDEIARSFKAN